MEESRQEAIKEMLAQVYGLAVQALEPAKRGFFGETWKVFCEEGDFFAKIDGWPHHKWQFAQSLSVVALLTAKGIPFVPPVISTREGALYAVFQDSVVGLFPFVPGENREDYPVALLFQRLAYVYRLTLSREELAAVGLKQETFGTEVLDQLATLLSAVPATGETGPVIGGIFRKNKTMLEGYARRLALFSKRCQKDLTGFHITHGDAGGNCILEGEQFTIIDWDQPKLAPVERDTWFFMQDSRQKQDIEAALARNGYPVTLDEDRFCYYCYHAFFFYLTEYLQAYFGVKTEAERGKYAQGLEDYFSSSWIFTQLAVADGRDTPGPLDNGGAK